MIAYWHFMSNLMSLSLGLYRRYQHQTNYNNCQLILMQINAYVEQFLLLFMLIDIMEFNNLELILDSTFKLFRTL